MDLNLSSSSSILISLFVFLAALLKLITRSKSMKNSSPPPGPVRLPLIGNLHHFLSSLPPHRMITNLARKYGPVMHLQLGEVTTIVVSSPEAAKEVLKAQSMNFADRPTLLAGEILCYNNTNMAFAPYGDYWRQLRKICTLELLSMRRVQLFRPVREEEFLKLCRWIASNEGSLINLTEKVGLTVCDIVMLAAFGRTANELATFITIAKEASGLIARFYIVDMYPSIKLLTQLTGLRGKLERLHKKSDAIVESIINDHKVANAESKRREDLVDVLLKFNEPGHELYLTTDNIKAVIQDMIGGGIETSSIVIDWAMAEMLKQPRILNQAQDEVRHVFRDKGFVDESDLHQLKYLKLVIKETLRMHPPVPLLLPRVTYEQCLIDKYKIPANTRVLVNVWGMGRDSECWKESESFIPERFLDNPVDYKGNNFEYMPFGGGRRICPGMTFGIANVELPLAMFLYHFDWVLPDGMKPENVDMTESYGIMVRRKNPLSLIPVVRNPLPM